MRRAIRHLLAELLLRSGALSLLGLARARLRRRAVHVLCYHRIADRTPLLGPQCIPRDEFDEQLRVFARRFEVWPLARVAAYLRGEVRPERDAVVLTFDDGYLDNYEDAAPLLLRHGIPATFYVSTDPLLRRRPYWYDRVRAALQAIAGGAIGNDPAACPDAEAGRLLRAYAAGTDSERPSSGLRFLRRLMALDEPMRLRVLDFLQEMDGSSSVAIRSGSAAAIGQERTTNGSVDGAGDATGVVTTEQLRRMQAAGFEVGGHSVSHPPLSTLAADRCRAEIAGSIEEMRAQGIEVRSFAYPFGRDIDVGPVARAVLAETGIELGLTTEERCVAPSEDPLLVPRKVMSRQPIALVLLKMEAMAWRS